MSEPDLDSILSALSGPSNNAGGSVDPMMQMMMMQLQQDRADRAASRQTMIQMVTALAPILVPVLFKKDADPVLMTLLQGMMSKNNDGEQFKAMLQMMQASSQMSMDQMKTTMLSILETKDSLHKKALEDALERAEDAEPASGPAAILKELRLGLGGIAGLMASAPAQPALPQPAQPAKLAAPQSAAPNPGQPLPPIAVILHRLQGIQTGAIKATPAVWAALATVACQDGALLQAVDDCTDDDLQPLMAYCAPHIQNDPKLLAWITQPGIAE